MATRFAIATGNWSNTAIWDNGALPLSDDDVHANGFTVTLDQDITVGSLRNTITSVYLPDMPIPLMTGNTQPSGVAFAGQNTSTAFQAFNWTTATAWTSTNLTNCFVGYQFPAGKVIKRYYLFRSNVAQRPISWTFEGSNDGVSYTTLETVTSNTATTPYLSGVLPNTTSFTYYRINITASTGGASATVSILEMTESTGTTYGTITGGGYTVPNTLSGSINIVQTGAGIICNGSTVVTTNNTTGNTVNFNISGGGSIFNQNNQTVNGDSRIVSINGNGTVNFNADINGTQSQCFNRTGTIGINANAIVNVYGNLIAPIGSTSADFYLISFMPGTSNSAVLNIVGNVISSGFTVNVVTILCSSTGTTNITGNITSNLGRCYSSTGGSVLNIPTGTVTVTNTNSSPAIIMTANASLLTINGPIINKSNVNAVVAARIRFYAATTPYWVFQDTTGTDITLTYGAATGDYPSESDVRSGTTYAASPTRTGTLAVPLPQYVSQGVPVDASVGTAVITPEDFLTAISSSNNPVAIRLKNVATVQSVGEQFNVFNP
jgi:hypothetical protein